MTRRARVSKLEAVSGPRDPVRVVITRHIVEGEGGEVRTVQIVRRSFDLYPEGLPGKGTK